MFHYEKKMKDKLDDEIKLAGLESFVPEELEKHLILNSNRLRTLEDARLEVMTYMESKFGLGIRESKPRVTQNARGRRNQHSFTPTILENLANLVKNYLGIIVRQRHTGQKHTGLLKERCAE